MPSGPREGNVVSLGLRSGTRTAPDLDVSVSGGGGGDMLERIKRLEEDMRDVKGVLQRMEVLLVRIDERFDGQSARLDQRIDGLLVQIDERIDGLPDRTFVIGTVIAIVGLVIAAIALAPYLRVPT